MAFGGEHGDWALVGNFRAENAALIGAKIQPRVVFIGDSITALWSLEPSFNADPRRVQRGISGQTTQQMLIRFRSDVINLRPAVVHIMGGLNDVANTTGGLSQDFEILGWFACMVELALAHNIKVILASVPAATAMPKTKVMKPGPRISKLNYSLKLYAEQMKIVYADYWSVLATPAGQIRPELARDTFHPNAAGFAAMEPTLLNAMERALAAAPTPA
jgi:lysophospholipase L1-like esterase